MRRFRWLYYLLRPSRVDFAVLAREPLPERMLARWLRDIPRDGRVHSTPGGVGVIRMKLRQLDGTNRSTVSMLTGMSDPELDELGGFPPGEHHPVPRP